MPRRATLTPENQARLAPPAPAASLSRRGLLQAAAGALGVSALPGLAGRASGEATAAPRSPERGALVLNDASEMSATPVWRHRTIRAAPGASTSEAIAREIAQAARAGRPVAAHAARHSMGGQSLARDGIALTLDQDWVEPDGQALRYRVAAGTRWGSVIRELDAIGLSPAVMQSNNDFGVASTFSVNAHGWPVPFSGCGSTVRALRVLTAQGRELACSRAENPELFRAAMGGYGLMGVITELELDAVPNARLEPRHERMPARLFGPRFRDAVLGDASVSMAYGRLDVSVDRFLEEALMVTYRPSPDQSDLPAAPGSGLVSRASRHIFRAQTDWLSARRARWWIETELAPRLPGEVTRNALLNEPVITLDDRDPARADILHEYFLAPEALEGFLVACRSAIPDSYQALLNVTLRYVRADAESLLAYAPRDRVAAVMLFSQEKTARAEADMARLTRRLIDAALSAGGSYYLPYRLHASLDQFEAAYPRARDLARMKRRLDPEGRFSNALWTTYLEPLA